MDSANSQGINIDLTRGHKEYESKVKNIEGILAKLDGILDTSTYKLELDKITSDCQNDPSISTNIFSTNMQMDYEGFVYNKYSQRLDALTNKLEQEVLPFYELYLLCTRIESDLKSISKDNINEIINNTIRLINSLNKLNTHDKKEKNSIIDYAYKVIYSVMLYEEIFARSDILLYIKKQNIPVNIENIGRLLFKDLNKLDKIDLIDEDLKSLNNEGLGNDFLNETIIQKISSKTVGEVNSEYQERKRSAIADLTTKVNDLNDSKNELVADINNNRSMLKNLYKKKMLILSKMFSLLLIPVITITAGHTIGKKASEKVLEYKTITRTIDSDTGQVIGDIEEVYDEHSTTYVATVLEQSPWKVNPHGGYTRTVTAHEYITPDNIDDDYHATKTDLIGNITEKYKYIEAKEVLDENDSLTDTTYLITETFQDKSEIRKSTKYILPFTITAAILSIVFDIAVLLIPALGYENTKRMFNKLNDDIKNMKLSQEEIEMRLLKLKEYALEIEKEYNEAVRKYGSLGEHFIFEPIDTTDIKTFSKSLSKKH